MPLPVLKLVGAFFYEKLFIVESTTESKIINDTSLQLLDNGLRK